MPITVFHTKGIQGNTRQRIEAAVVAGGAHTSTPYEAWIAADPFRGGFKVLIAGLQGFQRGTLFANDEALAVIKERIQETIEEDERESGVLLIQRIRSETGCACRKTGSVLKNRSSRQEYFALFAYAFRLSIRRTMQEVQRATQFLWPGSPVAENEELR